MVWVTHKYMLSTHSCLTLPSESQNRNGKWIRLWPCPRIYIFLDKVKIKDHLANPAALRNQLEITAKGHTGSEAAEQPCVKTRVENWRKLLG